VGAEGMRNEVRAIHAARINNTLVRNENKLLALCRLECIVEVDTESCQVTLRV
jgi:hypothetical protein